MTESSALGEYGKVHTDLPEVAPACQAPLRGERIATPVCALARNDMQKTEARLRLQGRSDMLKEDACQRLQGTGAR